jgi:hypothetical protein
MAESYGESEEVRTFTLSEARSLIPKLRKLLHRVASEREALVGLRAEVDRAREKAETGGGTVYGGVYLARMFSFTDAVQQVEGMGVQIKDFRTGLVDFPYDHDGRIVYLCWKLDEDEIGYWHEIEAGFAGRKPLTEEFA